jgi:predicted phosphodiesterase
MRVIKMQQVKKEGEQNVPCGAYGICWMICRRIKVVSGVFLAVLVVLGLVGFWMEPQARRTAEMMKSCEWINNDRCLAKVESLPEPGQGFRFAVFADVQAGAAQLPRLMNALRAEAPVAFVIQTGDAVSHADPGHYNLFLNELARSRLSLPMFVVPGNHDVYRDHEQLFERYFGTRQLSFQYGNALFILVDNALEPPDDEQYRWVENVLQNCAQDVKRVFFFMHHQPIHWNGDGKKPVEHLYEQLFQLLNTYDVDYVFAGNWHGYHREERNGTVFVVNGRGGDFDHDERLVSCYFTVVEIDGDSVEDRCIELPPRAGPLVQSLLKDWFIAHIGAFAVKNPCSFSGILLLLGAGCFFLAISSKRASICGRTNLAERR